MDFVLGALAPLAAAAAAFALVLRFTRRAGAAWAAGIVVGFVAGSFALEARDSGLATAAIRLVRPAEAREWLPLAVLAGAAPALVAALARRSWIEGLLAAPLCAAAPLRLLWAKHVAGEQRRPFYPDDVLSPAAEAAALAAVAAATFAAWWLWRRGDGATTPKTRSLLAIVATVGAAVTAALMHSLVDAQAFGVLAATLGGCAAAAWRLDEKSGPEAAPGPALFAFGGLLTLAVAYADLLPLQAAALALAFVAPVGWLPGLRRLRPKPQAAIRTLLCLAPLTFALWQAAAASAEQQGQQQEQADDKPYFR